LDRLDNLKLASTWLETAINLGPGCGFLLGIDSLSAVDRAMMVGKSQQPERQGLLLVEEGKRHYPLGISPPPS